jgi:SAM-dependent methyltransferase
MADPGYFENPAIIDEMSAEHLYLWRSLFRACEPYMKDGMRVLDFGCGNGSMLAYLIRGDGRGWPGWSCSLGVGIDRPSLAGVMAAASERIAGDLPVVLSSAPASAFPEQFDLVISHEVIYLLPSLSESFRDLYSCLAVGGVLAMATGCHVENELYARWRQVFARAGVDAHPYGIADYAQALRDAAFDGVEVRKIHLSPADYEEWVDARGRPDPSPDWFLTAEEERRYYTESGKILILGRRTRGAPTEPARQGRSRR